MVDDKWWGSAKRGADSLRDRDVSKRKQKNLRNCTQAAGDLRRGSWLGAAHSTSYGDASVRVNFNWGGSSRFNRLANELATPARDVYEFGVYTGGSMRGLARSIKGYGTLYGFDSFQGVPEETAGLQLVDHTTRAHTVPQRPLHPVPSAH